MPEPAFAPGSEIRIVEVLHGTEWATWAEQVLADDEVLVTVQHEGTALSFPAHPTPHPWGHLDAWQGTTVLKLRRAGEWYSVWKFFDAEGAFVSWYVNFETPYARTAAGVEVNDLQLDIVIAPDGSWRWKDVQDLSPSLASGRITQEELLSVLAAAAQVAELLDRDERWWAPWDEWSPTGGRIGS